MANKKFSGLPSAGALTGAELTALTQSGASVVSTVADVAAYASDIVVRQVATFAALPASPRGLYLVLADETKSGDPVIYLFTSTHRYWVAMVQDA